MDGSSLNGYRHCQPSISVSVNQVKISVFLIVA